ncbi:transmembrane gamma-carboxyglutamic acid protein 2 [Chanos chanos]|uniref:Transmembrane gamma-carboxyglutamic acid protein 2 n=1 Tax=Chanos chanos TaxID=29144 RepID=A0A6J2X049_CHACN|nr:transmembrane gamma-carboxyglutamic acid protein 2 [Chanos chanos]
MPVFAEVWICLLSLLHLAWARVINHGNNVFLPDQSAVSFLSRSLLYNSWDFELVVQGNLERECLEEMCSYEEAREVFENDADTAAFWKDYVNSYESVPRVDVSGLVAGILAVVITAVIATVVGCYFCKNRGKNIRRGGSVPVRMAADGRPAPEAVPLSAIDAPRLPSYNEALTRSGQHDAPPPPYSGGAPSEAPDPPEDPAETI